MRLFTTTYGPSARWSQRTRRRGLLVTHAFPLLVLLMTLAGSAPKVSAQGVFAGATSRSARQAGIAQKVAGGLAQAFTPFGIDDVTVAPTTEVTQGRIENLDRILKNARGRFFDTDFKAASKAAYDGMKRFEEEFAFSNDRDGWSLYGELTFVRTMALQRLGEKAKADRTLALLAAVHPTYVPDPGLVPPKIASRFQKVVSRLKKMGTIGLSIQSRPAGAEILVDGKSVGITPHEVTGLLPGPHFVSVKLGTDRAAEKVVVRKGVGEVRFDIGDPRSGAARALLAAISRAQSPESIFDAAAGVDARTFAAVVLPAGGDVEVLVGRFDGERLAAVVGTVVHDDLSDVGTAVERLVRASVDGDGEVWLPRPGESSTSNSASKKNLRGKFLGTVGNGSIVGGDDGNDTPEGELPIGILAVGGGVAVAVVVAVVAAGTIYYFVTLPPNPGGTDFLIDPSPLFQ